MPEPTTQAPATTQTPAPQPAGTTTEPTLKDLQSQFESIKTDFEAKEIQYKKTIEGLTRKISEDEKAIKQKELEKLSEVERQKAETEMLKAEKEKLLSETEEIRRDRIKEKALIDNNIPVEFAKRIQGQSESEITSDVKEFKKFIDAQVQKGIEAEINKRLGGTPPAAGTPPQSGGLQAAYDEAKKENKLALMTAIQRQANKEGITINL